MAYVFSLPSLTIVLLTASSISLLHVLQIAATYITAYLAAPREVAIFLDAVHSSVEENESLDRDVSRISRLEDKLRLSRLHRQIQHLTDQLREDLMKIGLLADEGSARLLLRTRLLWRPTRSRLQDRVRRLDLLRMRFLVVYMGLVASTISGPAARDSEKHHGLKIAVRPTMSQALSEGVVRKPPMRRLTTQMGHGEEQVSTPQRHGWAGVVAELQKSPLMHKRHASIEMGSP